MLAYTYISHGKFELIDKPKPELQGPRDAIVRITLGSICTSDLHIKHGSVPRAIPGITVGHEMVGVVEELTECIPDGDTPQQEYERGLLREELNEFLRTLTEEKRVIFVRRYFYAQEVRTVAREIGVSETKVKVVLHRLREELKQRLEGCDLL